MFYGRSERILKTSLMALRVLKGQLMLIKIDRLEAINPGRMMSDLLADFDADSTSDGFRESAAHRSADLAGEIYPLPISGPLCW
jgi:hypothetical protein